MPFQNCTAPSFLWLGRFGLVRLIAVSTAMQKKRKIMRNAWLTQWQFHFADCLCTQFAFKSVKTVYLFVSTFCIKRQKCLFLLLLRVSENWYFSFTLSLSTFMNYLFTRYLLLSFFKFLFNFCRNRNVLQFDNWLYDSVDRSGENICTSHGNQLNLLIFFMDAIPS